MENSISIDGGNAMKKFFVCCFCMIFIIAAMGIIASADSEKAAADFDKTPAESSKEARVYPIAPGVWYPGDGPLPDKPVRYYRVRCWPGCHTGSSHGMYPKEKLNYSPIWPTSTMDNYAGGEKVRE